MVEANFSQVKKRALIQTDAKENLPQTETPCPSSPVTTRVLVRLIVFRQLFFLNRVAAQELRQILRKRGARQHHVATGFGGLHLQFALHVRDEADDVGFFLQLAFELGDDGERLGVQVVQINDDERRLVVAVLAHALEDVFLGLDEFDLDIDLARSLLNLGQKEQVIDERVNASRTIVVRGQRLRLGGRKLLTVIRFTRPRSGLCELPLGSPSTAR